MVKLVFLASTVMAAQKGPAITGISHVTFYADDMASSQKFYALRIGWLQQPDAGRTDGLRFYANHSQYVELVPPSVKGQPARLDLVAFATTNAESLRKFIAGKGVAVPAAVTVEPDGSQSFLVPDPEGNPVEFTQQGRKTPPSPSTQALSNRLSTHIMHAGYAVHDRAAMDRFYRDVLGFHLYWQGGAKIGDVDWVMMQVPDGTDWIEYMLYLSPQPTRAALGSADHIAPGVVSVAALQQQLEARGWKAPAGENPQVLGVDGKLQLDLHDPDGTRIEFMEFNPVSKPCCSDYTGKQPTAEPGW